MADYLAHNLKRAAKRTSLPTSDLKRLIKEGELTPVVIGHRLLLEEHDLENLLTRHRVAARQTSAETTAG